jgi:hypothetical protein
MRLPNSGGQYTNTRKAAQEKRFEFGLSGGARTGGSLAAGAALDELIEKQIRQPRLVMPDHSVLMK